MKRLVLTLTFVFFFIGAALAAMSHNIKIRSAVNDIPPAFQLVYTSGALSGQESVTNETAEVFVNSGITNMGSDVEVADISKFDVTVTFTARLANEAKQIKGYSLSFTAGPFNVKVNGADDTIEPINPLVQVSGEVAGNQGVSAGQISGSSVPITFNGATCTTGNLATFTVTYPKNPSLDINLGGYYASISMEVTSV